MKNENIEMSNYQQLNKQRKKAHVQQKRTKCASNLKKENKSLTYLNQYSKLYII